MPSAPKKPKTVDEYLATLRPADRAALEKVRRAMREAAPEATEVISYGMPAVRTTMVLAWFAASVNHLAVYAWPNILDALPDAKAWRGTKSALHFSAKKPLPLPLVKAIVKAQLAAAKPAKKASTKKAVKAARPRKAAARRPAAAPARTRRPAARRSTRTSR